MMTLKSVKQKIRRRIERKTDPKPGGGLERQWVRCRECDRIDYYDYVPCGLDRPILTMGCSRGFFDDVAEIIKMASRRRTARAK